MRQNCIIFHTDKKTAKVVTPGQEPKQLSEFYWRNPDKKNC